MSKLVFSNMSEIIYILWDMTKILINLDCWTSHTCYRNFVATQSTIKQVVLISPFITEGINVLLLPKHKCFLLVCYRRKIYIYRLHMIKNVISVTLWKDQKSLAKWVRFKIHFSLFCRHFSDQCLMTVHCFAIVKT